MFYGHVADISRPSLLPASLRLLIEKTLATIKREGATGKYPLDGENAFFILADETTEPASARRPEIHARYLDVQILLEGEELMGITPGLPGRGRMRISWPPRIWRSSINWKGSSFWPWLPAILLYSGLVMPIVHCVLSTSR